MNASPVICFGQQPCGFFPRRFLYAKILTARRLQSEMGGEIVFFYHDSDHDPRETRTTLRHRKLDTTLTLNFLFANQTQRLYSPLYCKHIADGWHDKTALQLPAFVERPWVDAFKAVPTNVVSEFCLEMYRRMGVLDGIRVDKSSDPAFRQAACDISDFFVDAPYEGDIVRARVIDGAPKLYKGGNVYVDLPAFDFKKKDISPTRDSRLKWMQSVIHCTHYVTGAGEQAYLNKNEATEITFVNRDPIDRSDEAYTDVPR